MAHHVTAVIGMYIAVNFDNFVMLSISLRCRMGVLGYIKFSCRKLELCVWGAVCLLMRLWSFGGHWSINIEQNDLLCDFCNKSVCRCRCVVQISAFSYICFLSEWCGVSVWGMLILDVFIWWTVVSRHTGMACHVTTVSGTQFSAFS